MPPSTTPRHTRIADAIVARLLTMTAGSTYWYTPGAVVRSRRPKDSDAFPMNIQHVLILIPDAEKHTPDTTTEILKEATYFIQASKNLKASKSEDIFSSTHVPPETVAAKMAEDIERCLVGNSITDDVRQAWLTDVTEGAYPIAEQLFIEDVDYSIYAEGWAIVVLAIRVTYSTLRAL